MFAYGSIALASPSYFIQQIHVFVSYLWRQKIYILSHLLLWEIKKKYWSLYGNQHIIIWQTITIPSPKKKQDVYKWICITLLFDWHRRHTRYHKVAKNAANCSKQETISHNKQYFCVQSNKSKSNKIRLQMKNIEENILCTFSSNVCLIVLFLFNSWSSEWIVYACG